MREMNVPHGLNQILPPRRKPPAFGPPKIFGAYSHKVGPPAVIAAHEVGRIDHVSRIDKNRYVMRPRQGDHLLQIQRARFAIKMRG